MEIASKTVVPKHGYTLEPAGSVFQNVNRWTIPDLLAHEYLLGQSSPGDFDTLTALGTTGLRELQLDQACASQTHNLVLISSQSHESWHTQNQTAFKTEIDTRILLLKIYSCLMKHKY